MRTVSFSSPAVQNTLNEHFLCARIDISGDPTAGGSLKHSPSDPPGPCLRGSGQQNVQLLFLTPQGELFHALTGYIGPDELAAELNFALGILRSLREQPDDREQVVREAHAKYLLSLGFSEAEIERTGKDLLGGVVAGMAPLLAEGEFAPDKLLEGVSRGQVLADHRFAMRHPLLPWKRFKPALLVGSGSSYFGSVGSGGR